MAGNMKFSHAVGYRGLCSIKPKEINGAANTNAFTLLCTGGNINLTQDPIMSGGVWGAGYANAAPIAYAFNYLSLEGSVNFEWVNQTAVWNAMKAFAFTDRTTPTVIRLLPDGANGFHGEGWCSSISFEASEGAALTGSLNFKGDPSDTDPEYGIISNNDVRNLGLGQPEGWTGDYVDNTIPKLTPPNPIARLDELQPYQNTDRLRFGTGANGNGLVGATLIPYWNTKVSTMNADKTYSVVDDVINWSVSYNSDLQVLKCCSYGKNLFDDDPNHGKAGWGDPTYTPIGADYILCGEMSGEGSLTIFALRQSGACSFSPAGFHTRKENLTFTLGGFDSGVGNERGYAKSIVVPNALISNASTSMATGASYITTDYSFTAIGDGVNSVLLMKNGDELGSSGSPEGNSGGEGGASSDNP